MSVEPIRDKKKIDQMYRYLQGRDPKYALLFKFGLNTGLRISDMLPLKVSDILTEKGNFKEYLILWEGKTGKEKKIKLNETIRKAFKAFLTAENLSHNSFIFPSRKGGSIGRVQAYRGLREAAMALGIENFGTHSMRKTWGYWTYMMSRYNIGLIMDTFNHSSQKITLRYIGVSQDQKDELYSLVQL